MSLFILFLLAIYPSRSNHFPFFNTLNSEETMRIFIVKKNEIILQMKYCFTEEIYSIINNITSCYDNREYGEDINISLSYSLHKIHSDLQINRPFCCSLEESINVFIKRMYYLMNQREDEKSVSVFNDVKKYNIIKICNNYIDSSEGKKYFNENFGSLKSNGMICLNNKKREALFHALREKSKFQEKIMSRR